MNKRCIIVLIALIFTAFYVINPFMVNAASLSEIRKEIKEKQQELDEGRNKEKSLAAEVTELEKKIDSLEVAISEGEVKLAKLEKEVEEAQKKVDTQTDNLNSRLRNMYKTDTIGFVDVLLDSESFSDFLTNLDLVKIIYSADKDVLEDLKKAHEELKKKKKEAEELQAELKASKTLAVDEKAQVEAKKAEIAKDNKELDKMIDELQADADALTAKIQSTSSSSTTSTYTGGALAWPTPSSSYITSPFGYRVHPISGSYKFHTGIDIGASYGSSIVAANSGRVTMAGWYGGYGKCLIIDHGGGITTLYAHCSSLLVGSGQSVSRGQTVARVGSTGNSTGPHLHFEVRLNGVYKNPMNYVQ